jgi:hypothetical protein
MLGACAQIRSTSTVEILPRPGARPLTIGAPAGHITARGAEIEWEQHASTLEVRVVETRLCRELTHHPVVRVEHVDRKPGGALYWEYGVGAAALAFGLAALIRPEFLSPEGLTPEGEVFRDTRTGYRVGGVFTALGTAFLIAGIYDSVRARDATYYADAYRLELGERIECAAPRVPLREATVELIVEEWRDTARTDERGRVTFALPAELDLEIAAEPEPEPPPPPSTEGRGMPEVSAVPAFVTHDVRKGVIRLDPRRATAIDFAVPFASSAAAGHAGAAKLPALAPRR